MGSQYAGNPNFFPTDYTIPDDSDPPTAAAFNVALEALGDRTAYLAANLTTIDVASFATTDTFVAPPGTTHAIVEGWGGGGGGGGGASSGGVADVTAGGGGGGGALRCTMVVPMVAGETYQAEIGSGGSGSTSYANNGSSSTIKRESDGLVLCTFLGAGGGKKGGSVESAGPMGEQYTSGAPGAPIQTPAVPFPYMVTLDPLAHVSLVPQAGGVGIVNKVPALLQHHSGRASPYGTMGGNGGEVGLDGDPGLIGGGAGGGGGAGPGGNGGKGGDGTRAVTVGTPANGGAGQSASPNSGAGGGGGGAAGASPTSNKGTGGRGGDGGSGWLRVTFIRRAGA